MRQVWAALAAVAVLAGCTADADHAGQPSSASAASATPSTPSTSGEAERNRDWRTEVWHDVQLEVPSDWSVGYAPMTEGSDALLCGTGPLDGSDGPYVGRPGYGSDMCQLEELDDLALTRDGVWFGSPLPEADVISKNGLHQTTVAVGGSRVTVASVDDAVLRTVLASVEQVAEDGNGCPVEPVLQKGFPDEGYGEALGLSVCVYQRSTGDGWERTWSAGLPAASGEQLVREVDPARAASCEVAGPRDQLVLLRVLADDPFGARPLHRDFLVELGNGTDCPTLTEVARPDGSLALTEELVRPWASEGVRTYVWHNGLPRPLDRFFRPVWG